MVTVETLALLCAGAVDYHSVGRSTDDVMSKAEIAGYLAGLSRIQVNMALAKYAGDVDAERLLIAGVHVHVAGVAISEKWQVVKGKPVISNLCAVACFEAVRPNSCPGCQGTGFSANRFVHRQCSKCGGSGIKYLSGRVVSNAIGVDECNYRRTWRKRFDDVMQFVNEIDGDVRRLIYSNGIDKGVGVA